MWGGRFAAGPDAIMEAINASIGFDKRLAKQDIDGSRAHAAMLAAQGILTDSDAKAIREGLLTVLSEIEAGTFQFSTALEDIHMNVESRLKEIVGEPAGRLHTARSRNDQVATDFKLWVRDQMDAAMSGLTALMQALLAQALLVGFDVMIIALIATKVIGPWALLVVFSIPRLSRVLKAFSEPKPEKPPEDFPLWPLGYVTFTVWLTRFAGGFFVLGLILNWLVPVSLPW